MDSLKHPATGKKNKLEHFSGETDKIPDLKKQYSTLIQKLIKNYNKNTENISTSSRNSAG